MTHLGGLIRRCHRPIGAHKLAGLGNELVTHNLKQGQKAKAQDARLDRFGMFSIGPGGQIVRLDLDDLQYTASPTGSRGPETHSARLTHGVDLFRLGTAISGSTVHVVWGTKRLVVKTPGGTHTWGEICYKRGR